MAQFGQGVAADERGEQQAVGFQRALYLDQRARQIVDELQRKRGDDEIEGAVRERQRLLIGNDAERRAVAFSGRCGSDDGTDLAAVGQRPTYRIGRRAEIDGAIEVPQHSRQPLAQFGGHPIDEKRRRPERPRALPTLTQQMAIEDGETGHELSVVGPSASGRTGRRICRAI